MSSFVEQNEMYERTGELDFNKAYKPLYGIAQPSELSERFFGKENVETLHNMIRYLVYRKMKGVVIERQNNAHLMNVMRTVYLGYSINQNTQQELDKLNKLVLQETVPNLIDSIRSHEQYLLEEYNKLSFSVGEPIDTTSRGLKLDYNNETQRIGRNRLV